MLEGDNCGSGLNVSPIISYDEILTPKVIVLGGGDLGVIRS